MVANYGIDYETMTRRSITQNLRYYTTVKFHFSWDQSTFGSDNGDRSSTLSLNPCKGCHCFTWNTKGTIWNAWMSERVSHRVWNWLWWTHQHLVIYIFQGRFPFNSSWLHQLKWISYFLPVPPWIRTRDKKTP